jgi:hypothetical protein
MPAKSTGRRLTNLGRVRDYVRTSAQEPEVLRLIGEESRRNGTDKFSSREIDGVIEAVRVRLRKPR